MPIYEAPNVTGIVGLVEYTNTITDDLFSWIMVIGIFVVAFISMSGGFKQDTRVAAVSASFITLVITVLLWSIELINELALLIFGIIFAISMAILIMKGD